MIQLVRPSRNIHQSTPYYSADGFEESGTWRALKSLKVVRVLPDGYTVDVEIVTGDIQRSALLSIAVLTDNALSADSIEYVAAETGLLRVFFRNPIKSSSLPATIRALQAQDPDFILLDLSDWESVAPLVDKLNERDLRAIIIGFRPKWDRMEALILKDAGIKYLLREPFSPAEMESVVYEALHKEHPITNPNIIAFLPAKAGGGCSTTAIHTAAALTNTSPSNVLLIESDRRSGVYSIMLGLDNQLGLDDALSLGNAMTRMEWARHVVRISGFHLLAANPGHRRSVPSWADYYKLLCYVQNQYDYVLIDLPEVVNEATAEVVRSARNIFIVCTPEIPSLKMAQLRATELEACDIPSDRTHVLINRWERNGPDAEELQNILGRPVFATLPNDYASLRKAMLESRLASPESSFAEACQSLARKVSGLPESERGLFKFMLLRRLARIAG